MKIGSMFKDVIRSFFTKNATQLYPVERIPPPDRYRGILSYDASVCTGCTLCVKDCPSNAIELIIIDRAARRYVMKYRMDRCIYCGQCVVNCKPKGIGMSNREWEHATLEKLFIEYYGKAEDVTQYLAGLTRPATEPARD